MRHTMQISLLACFLLLPCRMGAQSHSASAENDDPAARMDLASPIQERVPNRPLAVAGPTVTLNPERHDTLPLQEQLLDPAPAPNVPMVAQSNVDFVSRVVFGGCYWHSIDYAPGNSRIYAGFGPTLAVLNAVDPAHPSLMGWVDTGDNIKAVVVSGNYAYVAATNAGLVIVDISNPSSPAITGTLLLGGSAYDLVVAGSVAYVAAGVAGRRSSIFPTRLHPQSRALTTRQVTQGVLRWWAPTPMWRMNPMVWWWWT